MVVQRTNYLDDKLMGALAAMPVNVATPVKRQVVLLGSGLDTKAWRLDFPSGTAIFEVDQRDMSGFKHRRLEAIKAQTDAASDPAKFKHPLKAASWTSVGTDLMHPEWVADLEDQGFQKGLPTAYVAEGLLYYLSPNAVKSLLATLAEISGPGSALLFSCINEGFYSGAKSDLSKAGTDGMWATTLKFTEAFQFGITDDVAGFLRPLGWDASADGAVKDVRNVYQAYGVQEFLPPKGLGFDKNREENEKMFGPKVYYLVNARLSP
ncbi:S-adenosyl-L-methionine-dependent methyltransferase [Coccomyxa subellipsoidea C-169]|uniref:S-adenosyl-L-methionine-dependent methyltransferase n=1 Tax=Coccomyxa subellipsoidea (strain C-169) TaxID=574566 RepID=I0YRM2_COCSC|nr:S-adenosyl-L-methionine-dependent methyltransferase [Coccomyxa subellipsoidea C-169]EIE21041.1 S-adenosyl-L-methionine-dependent methyltransferase [Coccomyxa subellipsoidea C-169]|eukprot:XP_005645585.1 S-adenosyl-L-methionine-dependent methyltransferase [Coccomyxa subellipsoidea C-169]